MVSKQSIGAFFLAILISVSAFLGIGFLEKRISNAAEKEEKQFSDSAAQEHKEEDEVLKIREEDNRSKTGNWQTSGFPVPSEESVEWLYFTDYDIENGFVYYQENDAKYTNLIFEYGNLYDEQWNTDTHLPTGEKEDARTYSITSDPNTVFLGSGGSMVINREFSTSKEYMIYKIAYKKSLDSQVDTVYYVPAALVDPTVAFEQTQKGIRYQLIKIQ